MCKTSHLSRDLNFSTPVLIPELRNVSPASQPVSKPSPPVHLISDKSLSSGTSSVIDLTTNDPISINSDCIFCRKGFMDCEDNIEGLYCLNFTNHYMKSQGDRPISKKTVIEKFEESYNVLKNTKYSLLYLQCLYFISIVDIAVNKHHFIQPFISSYSIIHKIICIFITLSCFLLTM